MLHPLISVVWEKTVTSNSVSGLIFIEHHLIERTKTICRTKTNQYYDSTAWSALHYLWLTTDWIFPIPILFTIVKAWEIDIMECQEEKMYSRHVLWHFIWKNHLQILMPQGTGATAHGEQPWHNNRRDFSISNILAERKLYRCWNEASQRHEQQLWNNNRRNSPMSNILVKRKLWRNWTESSQS